MDHSGDQLTNENSDADLLQEYAGHRCEHAFAALLNRYKQLVMSVCLRQTRNRQDAEDVFQMTFMVLAEKPERIRNGDALASWLTSVAFRLALNLSRRRTGEDQPLVNEPPSPSIGDSESLIAELALDEALQALPEKYRDVLVKYYLLGRTGREIARELRVSSGVVDGLVKRGRQMLRRQLIRRGVTLGAGICAANAALQSSFVSAMQIQEVVSNLTIGYSNQLSKALLQIAEEEARMKCVMTTPAMTATTTTAATLMFGVVITMSLSAGPGKQLNATPHLAQSDVDESDSDSSGHPTITLVECASQEGPNKDSANQTASPRNVTVVQPAQTSAMIPTTNRAYRLKPGDTISVSRPFADRDAKWPSKFVVTNAGDIYIPGAGRLSVSGSTLNDIRQQVRKTLRNANLAETIDTNQVDVVFTQFGSIEVTVVGPSARNGREELTRIRLPNNRADILDCLVRLHLPGTDTTQLTCAVYAISNGVATDVERMRDSTRNIDIEQLVTNLSREEPRITLPCGDLKKLKATRLYDNDVVHFSDVQHVPTAQRSYRSSLPIGLRHLLADSAAPVRNK